MGAGPRKAKGQGEGKYWPYFPCFLYLFFRTACFLNVCNRFDLGSNFKYIKEMVTLEIAIYYHDSHL